MGNELTLDDVGVSERDAAQTIYDLRRKVHRLRAVLADIRLLALEANEEYESSCRSKVNRIYVLAKGACDGK